MDKFISLGISEAIAETLKIHGISEPTPIQEKAIPLLLDGNDIIAQSQTGTGKTFAFVLPILEKLDASNPNIQALIVTPTRELALQITHEIQKLIEHIEGINILAVYGGQDVASQLKKLKKNIHIVVGTPGRLLDHIRRETVDFSKAAFLVLDEADQMLHIGFLDEVEEIIKQTPKTRQTLLFSATMPDEIRKLAKRHMFKPVNIQIEKTQAPLANIKQIAISTVDRAKQNDLIESLRMYQPFLGVIFCRTKRRVSKLNDALKANNFNCDELHGDLSQAKREQVMKKFRDAKIQYLIATDVAARGLDVDGVTHVFNYDMPLDTESYIHRIGRTGRAGSEGLAVSFYSLKDKPLLDMIESDLNIRIEKKNLGNSRKGRSENEHESGPDLTGNRKTRTGDYKGKNTRSRRREDEKVERDRRGEKITKDRFSRNDTKDKRERNPEGPTRRNKDGQSPSRERRNLSQGGQQTRQPQGRRENSRNQRDRRQESDRSEFIGKEPRASQNENGGTRFDRTKNYKASGKSGQEREGRGGRHTGLPGDRKNKGINNKNRRSR